MFERLRKWFTRSWESPNVALDNPASYQVFAAGPTLAGQPVTKDTVFALPAFLHGVDILASTMAGLDVYPYKSDKFGGKVIDEDHRSYRLLTRSPNDWQTPYEWKRLMFAEAVWNGNSYSYVDVDETTGLPTALVPLDPEQTGPVVLRSRTDPAQISTYYVTRIDGREITIPPSQVIHIKGLSNHPGGWVGMKLIDMVKEALGQAIAIQKFGAVYFKNAGTISLAIEIPEFLRGKEKIEEFRQGLIQQHEGTAKAHRVLLLQNGAKLASNPNENAEAMQFLQSRKMSIVDVASILRIPSRLINGENNSGTAYGNLEMEDLSLVKYSFAPWLHNAEQQYEKVLLSEQEKIRNSRSIRFDVSKLLEQGRKDAITNWSTLVNNGLCLPNVATAALGLPPVKDDENKLRLPSTVKIQGEEPEPPAPPMLPPQGQQQPQEAPQGDEKDKDAERLARLTEAVLRRFIARLEKAGGRDLERHREILVETLQPVSNDAERHADDFLGRVGDELAAVLPEQAGVVLGKIDVTDWTRRILA